MKKSVIAFVSDIPENFAVDCALSAILVVGFTLVGFLSRSAIVDLQANLLMMS